MFCSGCGHENPEQALFCENCGLTRAGESCAGCGQGLSPGAKFCGACGAPVQADAGLVQSVHLEAERRQLAVLFCDLVDSTALAQRVGDEALRLIINRYHKVANELVTRYDGHIAQYLGDGILIYFGYPKAHEDDSERAIRLARDLHAEITTALESFQSEFDVLIQARIGIHTGPVVISELGGAGKTETLALGETANIAARLDHEAQPGEVVISAATLKLVPGLFLTEPLGVRQLKGISEPVVIYKVIRPTGVSSRLDVDAANLSPLVGRDEELRLMLDRFRQSQHGKGQALLISGEAGFGKSRIVKALRDEVAGQPLTWLECHCSDYTRNSAFLPIVELVRKGLGFSEQTNQAQQLEALKVALARLTIPLEESLPIMARFLSLDYQDDTLRYSAELVREKTFEILVSWVLSMSGFQNVILHFEDAHWADPSSIELIKRIVAACGSASLLLVITFREGEELGWPEAEQVTSIALERLTEEQTRALVLHTLERQSPADTDAEKSAAQAEIAMRAEGNPLYAEELAKSLASESSPDGLELIDTSLDDSNQAIPSTLQGALMSRLDRLGRAKELAQTCAVLGRNFTYTLVRQISGLRGEILHSALNRLVQAELLTQHGAGTEAAFSFKHILIQQIAYQSVTRYQRREMHAELAGVLKAKFVGGRGEAEIIARHFDAAHLPREAISFYQVAAAKLIEDFANAEAISQLDRALVIVDALEPGVESSELEMILLLQLGTCRANSAGYTDEQLPTIFGRANLLSEQLKNSAHQAHALYGLGVYHSVRGDMAEATRLAEKLIRHAQTTGEIEHKCAGSYRLAEPLFYIGDVAASLEHFEQSISYYDAVSGPFPVRDYAVDLGVLARNYTAWCAWVLGKADQALELSVQGIDLARQRDDPHTLAHSLMFAAALHSFLRQWKPSIAFGEECKDLCEEMGIEFYRSLGGLFVPLGHARLCAAGLEPRDQMVDHVAGLEAHLGELATMGHQIGGSYLMGCLAETYKLAGRHEEAMGLVEMALGMARQTGQNLWDSDLFRIKAAIVPALGGSASESRDLLEQAREIARSQSAISLELRVALELQAAMESAGEADQGRHLLGEVFQQFDQGFDAPDLVLARQILDSAQT